MNCISVNCRGCRHSSAVQELCLLIETWKPAVVFLMETKMSKDGVMALKGALGFPNGEVVAAAGLGGGLALF
jgi:hypothetical protein